MLRKLTDFFDSTLILAAMYPATVVYVLFAPKRVLGPEREKDACPAGAAVVLSLLAFCWSERALLRVKVAQSARAQLSALPEVMPYLALTVVTLVVLGVLVRNVFRVRSANQGVAADLRSLSYAVAVGQLFYGVTVALALNFPEATVQLGLALDTDVRSIVEAWPRPRQFTYCARNLALCLSSAVFLWALFNIMRTEFRSTRGRAAAVAVAASIMFLTTMFLTLWVHERTENQIEKLRPQAQLMPPNEALQLTDAGVTPLAEGHWES